MKKYEIGIIGLGVMGCNLALNMTDHGFSVAGYDSDPNKIKLFEEAGRGRAIFPANSIKELSEALRAPRAVLLLVPAGQIVDLVISELLTYFQPGDVIIDTGNSFFKDTDRRIRELSAKKIHFMGVGISGGEEGARHGPSMMPGGVKETYERVRPIFEAIAAKVNQDPCVAYLGTGSAGHFVKMVHNGIEYGIMQLISETYDVMKRGLGFSNDQLHTIYQNWNNGELNSYLLEITSHIFTKVDETDGKRLIDNILDVARQKGTGMWTSLSAMELQVPTPTIDLAVTMRNLSTFKKERELAEKLYSKSISPLKDDPEKFIAKLGEAFLVGAITVYAQGMALLKIASEKYQYQLDLSTIAKIWRGGCIIRSQLLEDISAAFSTNKDLPNLLLAANLSQKISDHEKNLRYVVCQATSIGLAVPGFMSSLGYLDAYRSAWLPANLLQAQRDFFGAHTYERIDKPGTTFHTVWE